MYVYCICMLQQIGFILPQDYKSVYMLQQIGFHLSQDYKSVSILHQIGFNVYVYFSR